MENIFPNRRWLVIPITVTSSIDWSQVLEPNPQGLRISTDGEKTFVKYDITEVTASYTQSYVIAETGETGSYVVEKGVYGRPSIYTSSYSEYNYPEILDLLATPEWTKPITGSLNIN